MKPNFEAVLVALVAAVLFSFSACGTAPVACAPTDQACARQQAIDAIAKVETALNASVTTTRAVINSGALKGNDAVNAVKAIDATQASVKAMRASLNPAPAASAAGGK